jgi:hypothetical protein
MKAMFMAVSVVMVGLCGCVSLGSDNGGTIGKVQAIDDQLLASKGVPPEVTARIRKALGIVDLRTLPDSARVLPEGWAWKQDILDADGKVVDVAKLRKGAPYIVPDGSDQVTTVLPADLFPEQAAGAEALIGQILEAVAKDPALLQTVTTE